MRGELIALVGAVVWTRVAAAEPCVGRTAGGGPFALCFDPGNRLSLTAGSDGIGGSLAVRHVITFDDEPDLVWKMAHVIGDASHAALTDRFAGVLYRGRYLRHARDGHITFPLGDPKRIFLPFDVGGLAEVGALRWRPDSATAALEVIKIAPLIDIARTRGFRYRLAFGPTARWDVAIARDGHSITSHQVTPFSQAVVELAAESRDGRLTGELTLEGGLAWHDQAGWQRRAAVAATIERIVLAINDRPVALTLGVGYQSEDDELTAKVGARVVLVQR